MVGLLGEVETIGLNWMRGTIRGGLVTTSMELKGQEETVVFEIFSPKTKRKVEIDEQGNIVFVVNVKVKGTIGENQIMDADPMKPEYYEAMAAAVSKQIEEEMISTHRKLTELNADAAGVGRMIYQDHPKVWKQISDRWDEIFPTVQIQVKAEAEVSRGGLVRK